MRKKRRQRKNVVMLMSVSRENPRLSVGGSIKSLKLLEKKGGYRHHLNVQALVM